jgi:hypothetical protein
MTAVPFTILCRHYVSTTWRAVGAGRTLREAVLSSLWLRGRNWHHEYVVLSPPPRRRRP